MSRPCKKQLADNRWKFALERFAGKSASEAYRVLYPEADKSQVSREAKNYDKNKDVKKYLKEMAQGQALDNAIKLTSLAPQAMKYYEDVLTGVEQVSDKIKFEVVNKVLDHNKAHIPQTVEHEHSVGGDNIDQLVEQLFNSGAAESLIKGEAIDAELVPEDGASDSSESDSDEQNSAVQALPETEEVS